MSTALETITDFINDARTILQDTVAPYRYDDTSLTTAMNVALLEGRRMRPDLFVYHRLITGQKGVQSFAANDGTQVFVEEQFRLAVLYGLMAHALIRDQEDIQDERAAAFIKIFNGMLMGASGTATSPAGAQ